jgi:hypothetical protein
VIFQVCASGGLKRESIRGELNESRYRAGIPGSSPQSGSAGEPSSTGPAPAGSVDSCRGRPGAKEGPDCPISINAEPGVHKSDADGAPRASALSRFPVSDRANLSIVVVKLLDDRSKAPLKHVGAR